MTQAFAHGPYTCAVPPQHRTVDPHPGRPWTLHEGDNRCSLDIYDADHFDAIVTDCPYGLSTELDPPNLDRALLWQAIATEPNADGELALPIRELIASWMLTGENPRVTSKGFMGNEWDALVPPPNAWRAAWRVLKPGAYLFTFAGTRTDDLVALSLRFAGFRVEDRIIWLQGQGMAKRRRLDLAVDTYLGMKEQRPDFGAHPNPAKNKGDDVLGSYVNGGSARITAAATPEAARFVGWDRGLHPRQEPVIVASKPMRGLVAETVLRYGTGGMNVDGCRIERGERGEPPTVTYNSESVAHGGYGDKDRTLWDARGGYPTNVILDEASAAELDSTSQNIIHEDGSRGASRFFYVAKAATSERDKGLEALDVMTPGERSGREDGSAGINGYAGTRGEARNPHATVKPIKMMRYLVRLACPPDAWDPDMCKRPVVLDLYAGSGTTGVACMVEGVRFVGCELGSTYAAVARQRLQHAYALPREVAEAGEGEDSEAARPRTGAAQGKLF